MQPSQQRCTGPGSAQSRHPSRFGQLPESAIGRPRFECRRRADLRDRRRTERSPEEDRRPHRPVSPRDRRTPPPPPGAKARSMSDEGNSLDGPLVQGPPRGIAEAVAGRRAPASRCGPSVRGRPRRRDRLRRPGRSRRHRPRQWPCGPRADPARWLRGGGARQVEGPRRACATPAPRRSRRHPPTQH